MRPAGIRDAAVKAVLEHHPYLDGLVDFDIAVVEIQPFVTVLDLIIHLKGADAYRKLKALADQGLIEDLGIAEDSQGILDQVLDHYRVVPSHDDARDDHKGSHFELDGYVWLIGDEDIGGSVRMNGSHEARLWVRTWWQRA